MLDTRKINTKITQGNNTLEQDFTRFYYTITDLQIRVQSLDKPPLLEPSLLSRFVFERVAVVDYSREKKEKGKTSG